MHLPPLQYIAAAEQHILPTHCHSANKTNNFLLSKALPPIILRTPQQAPNFPHPLQTYFTPMGFFFLQYEIEVEKRDDEIPHAKRKHPYQGFYPVQDFFANGLKVEDFIIDEM